MGVTRAAGRDGRTRRRAVNERAAQSGVAGGFQRPVQTRQRRYCYPLTVTDHFSRRLLATQACGDRACGHARRVSPAVPRGRPARRDSYRQRRPVRLAGAAGAVGPQGLVDAARDYASTYPARPAPGQRQPRADASGVQTRNSSPPRRHFRTQQRRLGVSPSLQRGAAARGARPRHARVAMAAVAARLSRYRGPRIPDTGKSAASASAAGSSFRRSAPSSPKPCTAKTSGWRRSMPASGASSTINSRSDS